MSKPQSAPARKAGRVRMTGIRRRKNLGGYASDPVAIINQLLDELKGSKELPDISSVSLLVEPSATEPEQTGSGVETDATVEGAETESTETEGTETDATVEDVEDLEDGDTENKHGEDTANSRLNPQAHEQFNYPGVRICSKIKVVSVSGDRVAMSDEDKAKVTFPSDQDNTRLEKVQTSQKDNKFTRRFKDVLRKKKIVLEELSKFKKAVLTIQKAKYSILPARVVRVKNTNFYLIWGEMVPEETPGGNLDPNDMQGGELLDLDDEDAPDLVPGELNFEEVAEEDADNDEVTPGSELEQPPPLAEEEEVEIPDGATFTAQDVNIVMEQTDCTKKQAISALSSEKGDLVAAVLRLT